MTDSIFKKNVAVTQYLLWILFCSLLTGCRQEESVPESSYSYIAPQYSPIGLRITDDTLHFSLDGNTYNEIKSFNIFQHDNTEWISFYDNRSGTISIYDFSNQNLVKKILLKKCLGEKELVKTTVYVKSFDSIFVNNKTTLYLIDSSGDIKKSIDFLDDPDFAWPQFENTSNPVFKNGMIYAGVRPFVDATSLKALREWKVMYEFDISNGKASLYYHLPEIYRNHLYGYHFLDYNYCYNNKGNFVFSFPADSNIYETDFLNHHVAYYGKSKFQSGPILPVQKPDLKANETKAYAIRDSYGPIFYDPFRKRYLRHAKQKISPTDYADKEKRRRQSVIIFDQNFRIIGESEINDSLYFKSLFFVNDGRMYTRTNNRDEYALHFVRVVYNEKQDDSIQLTQNQ